MRTKNFELAAGNRCLIWGMGSLITVLLTGCGGGDGSLSEVPPVTPSSHSVSGTVQGLVGTLVLRNNSSDELLLKANGSFTFSKQIAVGGAYSVTIFQKPESQDCEVKNGQGTINGAVNNVLINCGPITRTVSGQVKGLSGTIVLQRNDGFSLSVSQDSVFVFPTPLAYGATYTISVANQPIGQFCTVNRGNGTVGSDQINDVEVVCSTKFYNVGGVVSGLAGTVVLQNNGADDLPIYQNGRFSFQTPVAHNAAYKAVVKQQPIGQTCYISNSSGKIIDADVEDISVNCESYTYSVAGKLNGLSPGSKLVLQTMAGEDLTLTANGAFQLARPIAYGGSYTIRVKTQPLWQFCSLKNASGTVLSNVDNVDIQCDDAQATVSTFAGSGIEGNADGEGRAADFARPRGIKIDSKGDLYVTDSKSRTMRKITPTGKVTTLQLYTAGGGAASLNDPFDLVQDSMNNIFITELTTHTVDKITNKGVFSILAGVSGSAGSIDGNGSSARFNQPSGIAIDKAGNLYVGDSQGQKIRKISSNGDVTTFAGSGAQGTDDGPALNATFSVPAGIAIASDGNMFVTDFGSHLIRKITPSGIVTTPFGKPRTSGSMDGVGNTATFSFPVGIAIDSGGSLYVADSTAHVIRRLTPDGRVRTLAGTVRTSGNKDGIGTAASFNIPYGVAVDEAGVVYVADQFNHVIRKITPTPAP